MPRAKKPTTRTFVRYTIEIRAGSMTLLRATARQLSLLDHDGAGIPFANMTLFVRRDTTTTRTEP